MQQEKGKERPLSLSAKEEKKVALFKLGETLCNVVSSPCFCVKK